MNKFTTSLFILFISINIFSQDCPYEELIFEQDLPQYDIVSSDLFAPINATLAADNFILDADAEINTVCWPGYFTYGGGGLVSRDNIDTRGLECDPANKNFRITYYNDGGGIPGNMTYTEDVIPSLVGNVTYYYTASHANVSIPANTTHWVSIQNIDDDDCEFFMIVGSSDPTLRGEINTREFDGFAINSTGNWMQAMSEGCINFTLGAVAIPPIPTLSQWGIFILGLLVMIFGAAYIRDTVRLAE